MKEMYIKLLHLDIPMPPEMLCQSKPIQAYYGGKKKDKNLISSQRPSGLKWYDASSCHYCM